jgi:hypothetical protein
MLIISIVYSVNQVATLVPVPRIFVILVIKTESLYPYAFASKDISTTTKQIAQNVQSNVLHVCMRHQFV